MSTTDKLNQPCGEVIIYQTDDGLTKLSVSLEDETVWLTAEQMAQLFDKATSTIREHILNIFKENELEETQCVRKIGISDFSTKPTNIYNTLLSRPFKTLTKETKNRALAPLCSSAVPCSYYHYILR